jgi:hypothetical protein
MQHLSVFSPGEVALVSRRTPYGFLQRQAISVEEVAWSILTYCSKDAKPAVLQEADTTKAMGKLNF